MNCWRSVTLAGKFTNVKTIQGGIVQLSGFAKSQSERTRAGEIARSVQGVTEVHNNLVGAP
ncbi:BON domain-containing protein [Castellaniella caeni]